MEPDDAIIYWVDRLWGITAERQRRAQGRLREWGIDHVSETLSPGHADGSVGAVLLVESFDSVVERGIEPQRLLRKLRGDPAVWPTWTEIRAAAELLRVWPTEAQFVAEPGRASGRQPDFAFVYPDGAQTAIEFKAIGLSDEELKFSTSVAPLLPGLVPRNGILTMHVLDTDTTINLNREQRRAQKLEAERRVKNIHPVARPIAAAVIAGHGTQESYTRRLSARFVEALAQLPDADSCWVAFHWSNGAPIAMVRRALVTIDLPENLDGIILTGTVGIPGSLDNYVVMLPRPFDEEEPREEEWHSRVAVDHAKAVLGRVDESSGVRPTLIRVPYRDRWFEFLKRGGEGRIFPFNLVLAPDPPDLLPTRDLLESKGS